jgi:hypothetical protein
MSRRGTRASPVHARMRYEKMVPRAALLPQMRTPGYALILRLAVSTVLILNGTLETLVAIDSVIVVSVYVFGFFSAPSSATSGTACLPSFSCC